MAYLDVTEILTDPEIASKFDVVRRAETVADNGMSTLALTPFRRRTGVITATSPNSLDRGTDMQSMPRSITVVTKFKLQSEVIGYQPDVVVWKGSQYLVKSIDLYPHFGPGFYQAECHSMDRIDPAITSCLS
jgi:galactose-6-phosphate isomerase